MNIFIRSFFSIIIGFIIGSAVNMLFIELGNYLFPIPGVNPQNLVDLKISFPSLDFKYFIFPFLAHSIGTLSGAFYNNSNCKKKYQLLLSIIIGVLFLFGGIYMVFLLSGPVWFIISDLLLAYIPMAWFGFKISLMIVKIKSNKKAT